MSQITSPFKFLDSYKQEDSDIFFGRELEINALYNALSGVKNLLVYGPSGAGKTSLIECGLRNQFSDADWFAMSIRRGSNMTSSVFARLNEALNVKIAIDSSTQLPIDPNLNFGQAIETLFSERYQPVYMLFDQFEELLLLGSREEKCDFFVRLNHLIRYKVPCRVLLVMREEFIGHLSEFESLCPSIFQNRFRLEKMGRSNVRQVINKILEAPKYSPFFRVKEPTKLADSILAKLPDTQREIELAHVQVFLEELWKRACAEQPHLPHPSEVGVSSVETGLPLLSEDLIHENDNLEAVLDSFLKNQLNELNTTYGENVPLELLASMISERHTKLQIGETDLSNTLAKNGIISQKPIPGLLNDLERCRILRTLKVGEQTQYEISHDILALVVGKNLTDEMKLREKAREVYRVYSERKGSFSQEDLNYLRAFEQYLRYSEELGSRIEESERRLVEMQEAELEKAREEAELEKWRTREAVRLRDEAMKGRTRAQLFAWVAIFVAIMAVGLGAFALIQQEETKNEKERAVRAEKKAIIQKNQADSLLQVSNRNARFAELKKKEALTQQERAELAAAELSKEKIQTELVKKEKEKQEIIVETQKEEAKLMRVKVELAAVIGITNVNVKPVSAKSSGKEKTKSRAKYVDKLRICFSTVVNNVADAGEEIFYIRIIDPTGAPLANESLGSGFSNSKATKSEFKYTISTSCNYTNSVSEVCGSWQPGQNFIKGAYSVEIYNKGYIVGTGAFNLK